ncbi:MAG: DUF4058 family protein [Caldilineaceae bacterium]
MQSPFPGMDPYIETSRDWPDFHNDLAAEIRTRLNGILQANYYASAVTYTAYDVIEIAQRGSHSIAPDVSVWRTSPSVYTSEAVAVVDPPAAQSQIPLEVEVRLANVEVRQTGTNRLVTAIEVLSPVNKRSGPQREKYLRKRQELFRSEVHVMEIDLLRGGKRSPLETPLPPATYYVTLGRAKNRPRVDIWPIQLADRLPRLPVPLLFPDPDVVLELGAVVRDVYERGAYARRIDYTQPVPPPELTPEQQAWVTELLAQYR